MMEQKDLTVFLRSVVDGKDLSFDEARSAMEIVMAGDAKPTQIAAYITALRMKGEKAAEVAGSAAVMREKATRITPPADAIVIDTCGTGGDKSHTFNISTAAALVAAACGAVVAKHGNRSVSSQSGSADVLATLGVNIEAPVPVVEECLRKARVGFLFAPLLHGAMKHAMGPRREIGIRTIFNILGPLTNPAGAKRQLLGVFSEELVPLVARALRFLGTEYALVVHGAGGLDEISTLGETRIAEVRGDSIEEYTFSTEQLGLSVARIDQLRTKTAEESASVIEDILAGKSGPRRDIVIANTAGVLKVAEIGADWPECAKLAIEAIDSGAARQTLDLLVESSNEG